MFHRNISIRCILQEPWREASALPFVITVDAVPVTKIQEAMEEIAQLDFHTRPPLALPMLTGSKAVEPLPASESTISAGGVFRLNDPAGLTVGPT